MRCALTIAGSDTIGGAGIQADIKAMAAVGVHAHTVITALTAQNTCRVSRIMPVPEDMIRDQFSAVMNDSDVRAVKTGMLYSKDIVKVVCELMEYKEVPFVADPVLVAGVGDALALDDLASAVRKELIPVCDIVTPNRYEAETLTGMSIKNEDDARRACEILGKEGTTVYLKGGHMDSRSVVDTLYNGAEFKRFEYPRLERAGHGGGCILSSYITAHLANGLDAVNSIIRSREMIQSSIASMYSVGKGDKLVNPMTDAADTDRSKILGEVNSFADGFAKMIPKEWIPKNGADVGYAIPGAKSSKDIVSIKGKITFSGGRVRKNGNAEFGASEQMGRLLMFVTEHDGSQRAAVSFMCSSDLADTVEEVGLTGVCVGGSRDLTDMVSNAVRKHGSVPDAVGCKDGHGTAVVFGRDLNDIMEKMKHIL